MEGALTTQRIALLTVKTVLYHGDMYDHLYFHDRPRRYFLSKILASKISTHTVSVQYDVLVCCCPMGLHSRASSKARLSDDKSVGGMLLRWFSLLPEEEVWLLTEPSV